MEAQCEELIRAIEYRIDRALVSGARPAVAQMSLDEWRSLREIIEGLTEALALERDRVDCCDCD